MTSGEDFGGHPLRGERLDDIALLHIGVIFEGDAALHAALDFAHVVPEPPQRADLAVVHHYVIPQQPHFRLAGDRAIRHLAARHRTHLADAERLAHFGLALVDLAEHRLEQTG